MFDLPNAKRVRRNEVASPDSSREPSPVDESDLQDAHARLRKLLDLDGIIGSIASEGEDNEQEKKPRVTGEEEEEEQEFEFRLFSAPTKPKDVGAQDQREPEEGQGAKTEEKSSGFDKKENVGTQKLRIRLRSPTPSGDPSEGRFVKASRGWQYYFATPSLLGLNESTEYIQRQAELRRQYEEIAVTGENITTWAEAQPWPGCNLAWRIIHLKRHQTKLPPASQDMPIYIVQGELASKSPTTRKKPGKKRRIQLRKKVAIAQAAKESEAEKRNRKNRERKIKRRQKAREQKAAAAKTGENVDVTMADGDDGSLDDNE
ncbi:hypothetical protein N7462_010892 [Penicillium macrosclerotiorum]|uniref:uncharacterized protein n=1 Tax=Penicillium macrosclerotiorum TaxID=303699 RepID=UPI0025480315|nr:uncharacterized protein N7462_010892 [Penicillium macrosclerotiorum]KAJ5669822.1 hypothetical protein N7462_010892 [Penicillium macrosclerotiorum]